MLANRYSTLMLICYDFLLYINFDFDFDFIVSHVQYIIPSFTVKYFFYIF